MAQASTDPFAGLKLSEQTPLKELPTGRDQRLFAPPPSPNEQSTHEQAEPHAHGVMTSKHHDAKAPKRHDAMTPRKKAATRTTTTQEPFDLAQIPNTRFSLRVTPDEYEALDDLERELRRGFHVVVSKNDLLRCALHYLIDDHRQTKEQSLVLRKLRSTS